MRKKQKKSLIKLVLEYIRYTVAGNVLFWGTYILFFVGNVLMNQPSDVALPIASLLATILYFFVDKEWVFTEKGDRRKTSTEMVRFILFMTLNYFINLSIVLGLERYYAITPYIGQFIAGFFFA
ncbi:MAG: GtrA family protein, partial [Microcoleus sp.]